MPLAGQPEPSFGSIGLGKKIEAEKAPTEAKKATPHPTDPRFLVGPGGLLSTNILGNEKANPPDPNAQVHPDDMTSCIVSYLPQEDPDYPREFWGTW